MSEKKDIRKELETVLKDVEKTVGDIEGAAIVRTDGLIMAFARPRDTEESLVAAMSAALLNIGTRTATELSRDELEKIIFSGTRGDVVLVGVGKDTIMSATTKQAANLGLVLAEMKRTSTRIGRLIR